MECPTVFDNLIFRQEMPVTIGVLLTPGKVLADSEFNALADCFNRGFEYDGLGDAYVRFILTEVLPQVEQLKTTTDGRGYSFIKNQERSCYWRTRSSGVVCAFTAAWGAPGISRVFSAIGTYIGLRGADRYPILIQKYEPNLSVFFYRTAAMIWTYMVVIVEKPTRPWSVHWLFWDTEVNHVWGEDGTQWKAKDLLYFLMQCAGCGRIGKTYCQRKFKEPVLRDLLIPRWKTGNWLLKVINLRRHSSQCKRWGLFPGHSYIKNIQGRCEWSINCAAYWCKKSEWQLLYPGRQQVHCCRWQPGTALWCQWKTVIADSIAGNDIVVARNGNIYVTVPDGTTKPSKLYLIRPTGEKIVVDEGLKFANGVTLSPDQTQLYVTESASFGCGSTK